MAMRLLTFTNLYPSTVLPRHGIFIEHRLRQLVNTGAVDARVVAPLAWVPIKSRAFGQYAAFSGVPSTEERHGVRIYRPRFFAVPKLTSWLNPYSMAVGALRTVRELQAERDFDVIDAHFVYPDGAAAILLGKWLDKPVVVSARGTDIHTFPQYRVPRRWIEWVLREASALVSVSAALCEPLRRLGAPDEKISVLRNGVDLKLFAPGDRTALRAELKLKGPLLLSVGHLVADKGHHFVIEALAQLPQMHLAVVGAGPMREELHALAARLGVRERVAWVDNVEQATLVKYYGAADMLVLASRAEGMPNVLLESMACGTPVISTDVGGAGEVVTSAEAGVLLPQRTATAIVAAVRALSQKPLAAASVRRHAEHFSWTATTEGLLALFERVSAHPSRTSPSVRSSLQSPG
jgi:glycosyltransferase involved in cell wall biosynthesis